MFEKLLNPQARNTLITDMLASSGFDDVDSDDVDVDVWNENVSRSIPTDLYRALRKYLDCDPPRKAQFLSHLVKQGATFTVSSKHAGNSCVLIDEAGSAPVPARIDYIAQLPAQEGKGISKYVAVRRYKCAEVSNDPFRSFPVLQTGMWSTQLADLEIISTNHIHTHFSRLFVKWEDKKVAIVSSMSRVSYLILLELLHFLT
jgi:hypothetical protein